MLYSDAIKHKGKSLYYRVSIFDEPKEVIVLCGFKDDIYVRYKKGDHTPFLASPDHLDY